VVILPTLRIVHLWLGLALALPLAVLGVTGAVLTLEPALPELGRTTVHPGQPKGANDILAAARPHAPPGMRTSRYVPAPEAGGPAIVQFLPASPGRGGGVTLRVDPVTLAPVGEAEPAGGVIDWMRRLHTAFLVPNLGGRNLVGWMGVGLVLITVIGVKLWWPAPGQARAAFTFSARARGVRFHRRLHGAVGIWVVIVLLVNAMTGTVLGFPQASRALLGLPQGGPPRPAAATPGVPAPPPDLDRAMALARAAAPGRMVRMVLLPASAADPLRLFLAPPGPGGATVSMVVIATSDGTRLIAVQDPSGWSAAERAIRWMHDLHESAGLGPAWRILTFLAGAALPVFAVTGTAIWLLKRRNRNRLDQARRDALRLAD
jgi:uncharacterized iron-regulated membrane protein